MTHRDYDAFFKWFSLPDSIKKAFCKRVSVLPLCTHKKDAIPGLGLVSVKCHLKHISTVDTETVLE